MSAYAKLSGVPVVEARVSFPRVGAWTAELRADSAAAFAGQVELQVGQSSFVGAVASSRVYEGAAHVRLVGGAGGLKTELPSKGYISSPLSVPLNDIARESGETLSAKADSNVTGFLLRHWARAAGAAGNALAVLLAQVEGSVWRFLPSGELWVGLETWPSAGLDYELTGYEPFRDRLSFFSLAPGLLPGMTFLGRKASYVEHFIKPERVETRVWFEEGS